MVDKILVKTPKRVYVLLASGVLLLLVKWIIQIRKPCGNTEFSKEDPLSFTEFVCSQSPDLGFITFWSGELGVTLLTACFLYWAIDGYFRARQENLYKHEREKITKDAMMAVLGLETRHEITQATIKNIFSTPIVRHNMVINYTIEEIDKKLVDADKNLANDYVFLTVENSFTLKNMSASPYTHMMRAHYPVCENPEPLSKYVETYMLCIDDESILCTDDEYDLQKDNSTKKHKNKNSEEYEVELKFKANQEKRVIHRYRLVKERSDTHVFNSFIPTVDLRVKLNISVSGIGDHGVRAGLLKLEKLEKLEQSQTVLEDGIEIYPCPEPLLPGQAVTLWWQPDFKKKQS